MDVVVRAHAAQSAKETATEDVRAKARIYCAETIVIAAPGRKPCKNVLNKLNAM